MIHLVGHIRRVDLPYRRIGEALLGFFVFASGAQAFFLQ
jgi:hypothetical protein